MNVSSAIKVVRQTHVGLHREHNEDAVASDLSIGLLLLADGMGGYKAGEIASEIAVLMISAELTELMQSKARMSVAKMLVEAVNKTNKIIYQISQQEPQCAGMGTTVVAGIFADNKLVVGHIGDSRMYRLRAGKLRQMTEDHSLIQEQINAGLITPEQAALSTQKNLVTRALGVDADVKLGLQTDDVNVGDIYLLCSDGLSDLVEDTQIEQILAGAGENINVAAQRLVDTANDNGGTDNISVVIAYIKKPFMVPKNWVNHLFSRREQRKIV